MIASLLTVLVIGFATAGTLVLYLLPVLIGAARRVPDLGAVAVVNILLGWTLAGWAIALAMAVRTPRPAAPAVQVVQNFPPPPPLMLGGTDWAGPAGPPVPRPGLPPPLPLPRNDASGHQGEEGISPAP
jgi:hypothetical protein